MTIVAAAIFQHPNQSVKRLLHLSALLANGCKLHTTPIFAASTQALVTFGMGRTLFHQWSLNEVGTDTRRLVESFRRWKRRRAYHKQLQRRKRAKGRDSSSPANDLRLGKH
jgi:hypothetical protein